MCRYTIRELVLVTLVAAITVEWGVDHYRLSSSVSEAVSDAQVLAYYVDSGTGWVMENHATTLVEKLKRKYGN
jgi:hypothetical protein